MTWKTLTWPVRLDQSPAVRMMFGRGVYEAGSHSFLLPNLWSLHLYEYTAQLQMGSVLMPIQRGFISLTPPGTLVRYTWLTRSVHLCAHLELPLPLSEKASSTATETAKVIAIPAMQDMGLYYEKFKQDFLDAVRWFADNPLRANVRLWDLLWRLAEFRTLEQDQPRHPAVRQTVQWIELNLDRPIRVSDLVKRTDFSHNQLTRLFVENMGMTIVGYIRKRRLGRATHLLTHSTLAIKAVAWETGFGDLQAFNKAIRQVSGMSPRALRQSVMTPAAGKSSLELQGGG